jgi:integrase/recombinase XerD
MLLSSSIEEFERYWRRRKPGTSTALHYSSDVRIFFTWAQHCSPDTVSVHDVDRFIEWQQSLGRAPTTITRRLIALHMFYDYLAYASDSEVSNPVVPRRHYLQRGRRLPRDVHEEVIQQLFEVIGDHVRDRCLFTLMLHAGLRVGEIVALRVGDVQISGSRTPQVRLLGKGRRERIVYLSALAAQRLQVYLDTRAANASERVFLNQHGRPMSIAGVQWRLANYCRQAKIWITCHQLRHTFASRLIAADVPVTSVQKLLGHSSLRTTQLYIRIADTQVERDYHLGMQKLMNFQVEPEVHA